MRDDLLTDVMTLASAWWVKALVFVAAALVVDLHRRRSPVPLIAATVAAAYWLTYAATTLVKAAVDRERPDSGALVDLPDSPSFPSNHASTSFAAAVTLSLLVPRTGWWALPLAALIAASRVYLGVHYWTDVVAGAALGTAIGLWAVAVRRRRSARPEPPRTRPR